MFPRTMGSWTDRRSDGGLHSLITFTSQQQSLTSPLHPRQTQRPPRHSYSLAPWLTRRCGPQHACSCLRVHEDDMPGWTMMLGPSKQSAPTQGLRRKCSPCTSTVHSENSGSLGRALHTPHLLACARPFVPGCPDSAGVTLQTALSLLTCEWYLTLCSHQAFCRLLKS